MSVMPATGRGQFAEALDRLPERVDAPAAQRADEQHLRLPGRCIGVRPLRVPLQAHQPQRRGDLRLRPHGGVLVEVGLVDQHQVRQFHHAALDCLQVVAGVGQLQQHEDVGHAGHRGLALADSDRLDDHHVVAGRLGDAHRLARLLGHAAERAARRAGADVRPRIDRQPLHPRLVAEDRAARDARRRVDGEHRHPVPLLDQGQTQRLDEGRLADPRHAGDAQSQRAAGRRQQRVEHLVGAGAVVGARRLQQRDRLGDRPPLRRAGLAAHAVDQRLIGRRQHQPPSALRICASTSRALAGIGVPGPKMPLTPAA
jgi:hypothetical protein